MVNYQKKRLSVVTKDRYTERLVSISMKKKTDSEGNKGPSKEMENKLKMQIMES